ncbi:MAG: acyltransferase [Alphaproteobacteria bacterium]
MAEGYAGAPRTETVVAIQYLRAVAAGLIAFQHAMGVPVFVHYTAHFGTVGVDLFFVISGFIMWTTTARRERGPVQFWLARIVRIVPLYWIFTTLYVAAALITPESFYVVHLEAAHIVKSYLFVPATHPNLGLIAPVYTLGWTLNYEMFFYLLFGFCLFVPWPRTRFALFATAFLLLVAGGLVFQPGGAIARTYTDPILLEFLAGVMLAILAPVLMRCGTVAGLLLVVAAILWVAVVYGYGFVPERIVSHGIPAVTAVAGALMIEPAARARPSRLWLMLGDASYSIYLAHPFAQRILLIAVNRTVGVAAIAPTLYVLTALIVGIVGGVICHFVVERPLLIVGRKLIGRA